MVHENIVKYYHCFEDDDFVYLVLELCESKVKPVLGRVAVILNRRIDFVLFTKTSRFPMNET